MNNAMVNTSEGMSVATNCKPDGTGPGVGCSVVPLTTDGSILPLTFRAPTYAPYEPAKLTGYVHTAGAALGYQYKLALNKTILCEPFKTAAAKKQEKSGFATIQQKVTLTPLKVLVGTTEIPAGYTAYVKAEACNGPWGKEVFEAPGLPPFIKVPEADIVFVERWDANTWSLSGQMTPALIDGSVSSSYITAGSIRANTIPCGATTDFKVGTGG